MSGVSENLFFSFKAILESLTEAVLVIDADGKIILANKAVTDMLDTRIKDIQGKYFWEAVRNEGINALIRESIQIKQPIKREIHVIAIHEDYFNVQTSVVLNERNEFIGIAAVFHNITELKKIDKMRSEFTANVSHELKTPLTSIKGFVETLLDGAINDKEKSKEFLNILKTHTEKLENLINDLLNLSKIESKELKMQYTHINVSELIKHVAVFYKSKMDSKQQKLSVNVPDNIPLVSVDELKLEQVFSNLLDNAIKFTPNGGSISILAAEEKDFIRIDFKDTGIGIQEEHLPHIFERFYRVDKTRSREMGGTGLGLSIVKHIMEAHGGKVTVESFFGKGSVFSVFIPGKTGQKP